jgi:hypothetical protein
VASGGEVKFPNLLWAMSKARMAHYAAAAKLGISETRFSRCLTGRIAFSVPERERLAQLIGYPQDWLFQEVAPPQRERSHRLQAVSLLATTLTICFFGAFGKAQHREFAPKHAPIPSSRNVKLAILMKNSENGGARMTSNLTPKDLAKFDRFHISLELLNASGVERVDDIDARNRYGIVGHGNMAGIAYPYINPTTGRRVGVRIRRDNPEQENGKTRKKYVSGYGDRRHLYFAAGSEASVGNPDIPVILVEAELSSLALTSWARRMGREYLVIALGGCWGWHGRIGKTESATGAIVDELGALPDLSCAGNGREVFVLLDSNVGTNRNVQAAETALIRELERGGARVRIAHLPPETDINGPDDFVAVYGDSAVAAVIDAAATPEQASAKHRRESNQTQVLLRLADESDLFHTPDGQPYATVRVNSHTENLAIDGTKFRQWLRREYHDLTREAPRSQALQDTVGTLACRALFDGPEREVFLRVGGLDERIFVDLGDSSWHVVEIQHDGWRVVGESPVKFRRAVGMLPLPTPICGGSVGDLRAFVNITDEMDWRLLAAFVLQCFRPRGPYPILVLNGEHGSAKTTAARVVRALIDPNSASHSGPPRDIRDVMIAAHNSWIVSLDNLSVIDAWLSDALCRLATGGGLRTRKLYTDVDETILDLQRPIIFNGIEHIATRPDLLDRAIVISLPKVNGYRDERTFWNEFRVARPMIFGALLDVVAGGLARVSQISIPATPRMADFAVWGTAVEHPLGWRDGGFMQAYSLNRFVANDAVIEASTVGAALEKLAAGDKSFEGTATALLKQLEAHADEQTRLHRSWPHTPLALRNAINRLAPNLRAAGVEIELGTRDTTRMRNRIIRVRKASSAASSASVPESLQQHEQRTAADAGVTADAATSKPSGPKPMKVQHVDVADGMDDSTITSGSPVVETDDVIEVEL